MCASAPKAPPPTPQKQPRILLTRRAYDDLMLSGGIPTGSGGRTTQPGMGTGGGGGGAPPAITNPGFTLPLGPSGGPPTASGLRIAR